MAQQALKQYIEDARKVGMSNEEIVTELTQAGWQVHDLLDLIIEPKQKVVAPTKENAIISVRGVSKHYGKVKALDNVSLDIQKGGVTALLGPNGAGKTTLVRILTTLLTPTAGQAIVAGYNVLDDAQNLRKVIGLTGQYAAVDEMLTGRENLQMVGRLYHLSAADANKRAGELLERFDLVDAGDRIAKTYSGGMRRRLDLAASLIMKPKVLFLDEPTTGLDPRSRFIMWNIIRDLVEEGTTVLLTTQYLEEADQLARYIFVIDHGHIIAQGTADDLKKQVGGDVLELHLSDHHEVNKAADVIREFGSGDPEANPSMGIVTMPTSGGASILVEVVRKLDTAHLKISDIILRRPSLDDVFMKLTGHSAEGGNN